MSSTSSPTLICDVRARRAERCVALLALTASAVGLSLVTSFSPLTLCALFAISGVLLCCGLHRAGWLGARRIASFAWSSDGRWQLIDGRGVATHVRLRSDSRVGSRWVWLRWDTSERWSTRSLLIFAGDVCEGDIRRLAVRLRIEGLGCNTAATQRSPS